MNSVSVFYSGVFLGQMIIVLSERNIYFYAAYIVSLERRDKNFSFTTSFKKSFALSTSTIDDRQIDYIGIVVVPMMVPEM